uniref:Peptide methionine sulfoxide reductase MsrA n=1 Tax=uncultured Armatimonadetes bacterium TaxID=157466 RepID=A0A6J4JF10_9BACT|nr:Peptide-methionine (S)-S-oxide reductase MsrA [uncultured Armatimonadetes bacterium]
MRSRIGFPAMSRRTFLAGAALGGVVASLLSGCVSGPPASAQEKKKKVTAPQNTPPAPAPPGKEIAVLANGCFWCTEAIFTDLKGVEKVESGYTGGQVKNPTYEQVCTGRTGHAEAIRIVFDPKAISYHDLLSIFFATHDPTTLNRQGADVGTQYRSAIFYQSPEQKATAEKVIREVEQARLYKDPIVTQVVAASEYYPAEDYHRDYFARNPNAGYCRAVIAPKVAKFRDKYREKLKR